MRLLKNMVLEWPREGGASRIERIVWLDPLGQVAMMIHIRNRDDAQDAPALPEPSLCVDLEVAIDAGRAIILEVDPYAVPPYLETKLSPKQCTRRDVLWAAIRGLVEPAGPALFDATQRAQLVADAMASAKLTRPTLYRALRRFWQRGLAPNALVPDFTPCGGPGQTRTATVTVETKRGRPRQATDLAVPPPLGLNVDAPLRAIFEESFLKFRLEEKRSWRGAYQKMLEVKLHRGYRLQQGLWVPVIPTEEARPSFGVFRYWCRRFEGEDLLGALRKREGQRRVNLKYRAVLGRSTTTVMGPGDLFQLDATPSDVQVVDDLRTGSLGRPVLYVIIDVFSRLIVGFYVGLESPSWEAATLALINMVTPKRAYCQTFGIEITEAQWPSHHLPDQLLCDRGEMVGYSASNLVKHLGVQVKNAPPYRADWKGIVERNFRLMNREIHGLPGAVLGPKERGTRDPRLEAALTLSEFRAIMIWCIWEHNNYHRMPWFELDEDMIRDGVLPFPVDLWRWGAQHRMGYLRPITPDAARLALLPSEEAVVTREGLLFKKLYYTCAAATTEQWFEQAGLSGRWRVPVGYDPQGVVDTIYLRQDQGRVTQVCHLLPKDAAYAGRTWPEVVALFKLRRVQAEVAVPLQLQGTAVAHTAITQISTEAITRTTQARAGLSQAAVLRDMRPKRLEARARDRGQTAPPAEAPTGPGESAGPGAPFTPVTDGLTSYVRPVSRRAARRQQQHEEVQDESTDSASA